MELESQSHHNPTHSVGNQVSISRQNPKLRHNQDTTNFPGYQYV